MFRRTLLLSALAASAALPAAPAFAAAPPLRLEVFNPGAASLFPVTSVLVTGKRDAVLIDAQFQRNDAEALVQKIRASGKRLTTIYISHSDPDFYFGLDVVHAAFPQARIVATPSTLAAIRASRDGKIAHWGPILKANAPQALVEPQPLKGDHLLLEGQKLQVVGLDGPTPARTVLWIPSIRAVVGGVPVSANIHLWVADTQTPAQRMYWQQTLDGIDALQPRTVVPGHYLPNADGSLPHTPASVQFTRDYLRAFDAEAAQAADSRALVAAMQRRYPQLGESASLDLSAKVIKGEMQWPK
ncbi:glyoxylase-like metal-dependent hydrolase (beta-lactamase superfamily II) [Paracidovorax wautersii]|uniref:Glyoxylase-like metal-dependent hydrolase (Beta-lactamase superfamily II) n=1 Tax=Paracidovorax wautersii TaxID=1177982 RepID=A0ABU1IGN3_9BURK|nr:glyoxylase-like metal-dependent hydrolase (beta-lactamase superfamily II) [Paracidovorax wautersii]